MPIKNIILYTIPFFSKHIGKGINIVKEFLTGLPQTEYP